MIHNEDLVEEVATARRGKVDSVGAETVQGRTVPNLWCVRFLDGKEPPLKYFQTEADLRVISCPHGESEPGFYPERPLVEP